MKETLAWNRAVAACKCALSINKAFVLICRGMLPSPAELWPVRELRGDCGVSSFVVSACSVNIDLDLKITVVTNRSGDFRELCGMECNCGVGGTRFTREVSNTRPRPPGQVSQNSVSSARGLAHP